MIVRILFLAVLIASVSLRAMKRDYASIEKPSATSDAIDSRTSEERVNDLPNIFVLTDGLSKKKLFERILKLTCRSVEVPSSVLSIKSDDAGTLLAAHCEDGEAYLINVREGDRAYKVNDFLRGFFPWGSLKDISSVALNCTGTKLAVEYGKKTCVFDVQTREASYLPDAEPLSYGSGMVFSRDGSLFARCINRTIHIMNVLTGALTILPPMPNLFAPLEFNHDGTRLVTRCLDTVRIVNVSSGSPNPDVEFTCERSDSLSFSSDGKYLVRIADDCTVSVIDIQTGEERGDTVHSADKLFISKDSTDTKLRIINAQTGILEHEIAHPDTIYQHTMCGKWVTTSCGDKKVRVINTQAGVIEYEMAYDFFPRGALTCDGRFAAGSGKQIRFFNVREALHCVNQMTRAESNLLEELAFAARESKELAAERDKKKAEENKKIFFMRNKVPHQTARIHANPKRWAIWESLKVKLNGGKDVSDCRAVQRLSPYIVAMTHEEKMQQEK